MKKLLLLILFITQVSYGQTTFIPTGGTSLFDLQSVTSPVHIIQDKNNPDNIHVAFMSAPYSDSTTFNNRTVQYFFSSDRGLTWNLNASFSSVSKAGFPSISLLNNGNAIITFQGGPENKTYTYADAFPGLGSFLNLGNTNCMGRAPQIAASNSISISQKFYIINSIGYSTGLSLTNPSYSACAEIQGISPDGFSIATGKDGRIGIAYIVDPLQLTGNSGDVFFIESTDNGQTFSSPLKIYDAVINSNNVLLGALRGISLVYNNNTPNVVFEVAVQTVIAGLYGYEPGGIIYWSPNLNGADPHKGKYIARNDSTNYVSYIPFYKTYGNDQLSSICRPSIGTFTDSNYMAVAFMASTPNIKVHGFDTLCYSSIYLTYTYNKGASWVRPKKITPDESMDWTYPSVSKYNFSSELPYKVNIIATKDTLPGSYFNNSSFGKSMAQQFYLKSNVGNIIEPVLTTTTTGNIKYNDNGQVVTGGIVKALRFNEITGEIIVQATSPIDINGNYSLSFDAPYSTPYIVAYPNSEQKTDFIPTYYPQTIDWQNAVTVNSANNNFNINISVFRKENFDGPNNISGLVNQSQNLRTNTITEASIYLKLGNSFAGFTESNTSGRYGLSHLPNGDYEIIATKLGYSTSVQNIHLKGNIDSVNFALKQILVEIHQVSGLIPAKFNLYQNYPNPFNPVTNIKFDISKSSFVTIKVYNILGKEEALLLNENKSAGSYQVSFNASMLSSGVYFYTMETKDFVETKRMVILK